MAFLKLIFTSFFVGTIPCQVDTYKNENTVFLIRPNRGNIPPRFGHFF